MNSTKTIVTYTVLLILTLGALFFIKVFDISYPVKVSSVQNSKSSEIKVTGEGKVDVIPDMAKIEAGIVVNGNSVDEVQRSINEINDKIINTLKTSGVEKKDIQTSSYSISPDYDYNVSPRKIKSYNGSSTVGVKIRNFSIIPQALTKVTESGANQVYGVSFSVENIQKYRDEARKKAISNAKEAAKKLSEATGISLGKITNITESEPSQIYPMLGSQDSLAKGLGGPNIEPGTQTITLSVALYYEKK